MPFLLNVDPQATNEPAAVRVFQDLLQELLSEDDPPASLGQQPLLACPPGNPNGFSSSFAGPAQQLSGNGLPPHGPAAPQQQWPPDGHGAPSAYLPAGHALDPPQQPSYSAQGSVGTGHARLPSDPSAVAATAAQVFTTGSGAVPQFGANGAAHGGAFFAPPAEQAQHHGGSGVGGVGVGFAAPGLSIQKQGSGGNSGTRAGAGGGSGSECSRPAAGGGATSELAGNGGGGSCGKTAGKGPDAVARRAAVQKRYREKKVCVCACVRVERSCGMARVVCCVGTLRRGLRSQTAGHVPHTLVLVRVLLGGCAVLCRTRTCTRSRPRPSSGWRRCARWSRSTTRSSAGTRRWRSWCSAGAARAWERGRGVGRAGSVTHETHPPPGAGVSSHRADDERIACTCVSRRRRDEQLVVLAKARGMCKLPPPSGGGGDASRAAATPSAAGAGCFGVDCLAPEPDTAEQLQRFRSMRVEDLRAEWVGFVTQASQLLAQAAMAPPTGAGAGDVAAQTGACLAEAGAAGVRVLRRVGAGAAPAPATSRRRWVRSRLFGGGVVWHQSWARGRACEGWSRVAP